MRLRLPWQLKLVAKLLLSRLRLPYRLLAALRMFRHGDMENADYALGVFEHHLVQSGLTSLQDKVCLELGPGDALTSALIAHAHGARQCYLVDAGAFASTDIGTYRVQSEQLRASGMHAADLADCHSVEAFLSATNSTYLTGGLESLRQLPDASIDFIWSHAVLEHVRLHEFDATLAELGRILKPDGVCSHRIDLQDHLAASLHNLRFRRETWEKEWMARSGFYTNRVRFSDMVARFEAAGFCSALDKIDRWEILPVSRKALNEEFAGLDDDELRVQGFDAVLRHPQ